jgi:hypothetical protein
LVAPVIVSIMACYDTRVAPPIGLFRNPPANDQATIIKDNRR